MQHYSKIAISSVIAIMVMSSPVFMLVNPAEDLAATADKSVRTDTRSYHSSPRVSETTLSSPLSTPSTPTAIAPSTLSQDGEFTTQAALSLTRASQTNNFVASKAYYDISFRTATGGVIKSVVMDFPTGTSVGSALLVEAIGIGPGTISASAGEVLTYTVTNAVNVPANTIIRIQISNINNPPTPSSSLAVSITTRDPANVPIDGPTATTAYNMVQIGNAQIAPGAVTTTKIASGAVTTGDIADSAITSTKPAESFMKKVTLQDNTGGNALGWTPDGMNQGFFIMEPAVSTSGTTLVSMTVGGGSRQGCEIVNYFSSPAPQFLILCQTAPDEGDVLDYVVMNLPAHVS